MKKNDKDTEIRELERAIRILRGNSNLHNQIAALTTEITTLKKDRELVRTYDTRIRQDLDFKKNLKQKKLFIFASVITGILIGAGWLLWYFY